MKLDLEADDLRPLVRAVVAEILGSLPDLAPERLAFPEVEAAQLLGLPSHRLREARRRGELKGTRVGRAIVYQRGELLRYLADRTE